jgi:hypothetical protein
VCVPEGDGTPTVQLAIGPNTIINEVVPLGAAQLTDRKEYTVQSIAINTGDIIKVTGTSNALAFARIDKIVFTDGNSAVLEFKKTGYYPKEEPVVFGTTTSLNVALAPVPGLDVKPGAHNTGPTDRTNMTVKTLTKVWNITQNGAVFENIHIKGAGVNIAADNVVFRNFIIDGGEDYFGIRVMNGHKGILLENGEIFNLNVACLKGVGYTARRLHLHDVAGDHTKPEGNGGPTLIEYCFMEKAGRVRHGKCFPNTDMYSCPHADGVQIQGKNGAHDVTFRYNNWYMPYQQSPNAVYNADYGYISNQVIRVEDNATKIVVENNWLNGGSNTVSINGDVTIRNNRFGRDFMYGIMYPTSTFKEWTGNVWDDTGVIVKPTHKGI